MKRRKNDVQVGSSFARRKIGLIQDSLGQENEGNETIDAAGVGN
jgi:hypothetical protein